MRGVGSPPAPSSGLRVVEGRLPGARGLSLYWQAWLPPEPRSRVLAVHGYGEHSGRYQHLAGRLAEQGHQVVALDHRGHGRSEGRPVSLVRFDDYIEDLHRLAGLSRQRWGGGLPQVMLGHSMGGLIAAVYALDHGGELAGLVLSAPAVLPPRDISAATIWAGRLLSRVAPDVRTVRLPIRLVSRDQAVVEAYHQDPRVHRHRIRARLGAEMLRMMERVEAQAARLTLPVLLLQGGEDRIVDPGAARHLHERVGSADRTLREYPGLYHEIFNEPEREMVIDDLLEWLEARFPPVAGGARSGGAPG